MCKLDETLVEKILEDMEVALKEQHYELDGYTASDLEEEEATFCVSYIMENLGVTYAKAEAIYFDYCN